MKPSNALASFRQLCCLGLPRETLIAELLTAVQAVIPSSANVFVGLGPDGLPSNVIPEFVIPEALEAYTANLPGMHSPSILKKIFDVFRTRRIMDDLHVRKVFGKFGVSRRDELIAHRAVTAVPSRPPLATDRSAVGGYGGPRKSSIGLIDDWNRWTGIQ